MVFGDPFLFLHPFAFVVSAISFYYPMVEHWQSIGESSNVFGKLLSFQPFLVMVDALCIFITVCPAGDASNGHL